ncbi:MAG: hypothetical protein PHR56_05660 [Dehalococcoidales bacterium]|nr:hypothetical protein [Dehalococcoidales bacterium]
MSDTIDFKKPQSLFEKILLWIIFGGAIGFILYLIVRGVIKYSLYNMPAFYFVLVAITIYWVFGLLSLSKFKLFRLLEDKWTYSRKLKPGELKATLIFSGYLIVGILGSLILGDVLTGHGEPFVWIYIVMVIPASLLILLIIKIKKNKKRKEGGK